MPEPARTGDRLLTLDAPAWLARAVAPWRVTATVLWRSGGVRLELRSDRARIPVLIEDAGGASPRISLLDPRIPARAGATFVRALHHGLAQAGELRPWLARLSAAAARLRGDAAVEAGDAAAAMIELWRAWPARDVDPARSLDALPEPARARVAAEPTLPRPVRAALILHGFARGEVIEALAEWEALGSGPSFAERHLDALALAILGRRDEARAALAAAGELVPGSGLEAEGWLAIARASEELDDPAAAIAAHERVIELRDGAWDRLRLARVRQAVAADAPIPRPERGASDGEKVSFVRQLIKVLDSARRWDETLAVLTELLDELQIPPPAELVIRAAQLHLWRGEGEAARARLAALARDDPRAQVIHGALAIQDGRAAAGLAILEALTAADAPPLEALLWEAEALIALDRPAAALARVDRHILRENTLVAYLLKLYLLARLEPAETIARSVDSLTFLDGLVRDVLPTLRPPAAVAEASRDAEALAALARGILDDMGGNRTATPSWLGRDADGRPRLEPVRVRPSGREAAVANLVRIRSEAPAQVLAGFDAVTAEYPSSPHPWTYRGELLIWLGRYEDALASFDESDARAPTRWAHVGRAAAYDLLDQPELADHWTREGIVQFGELETATTHVYRGERMRKLEDWPAARRDLEIAVAHKPRRIGARINLALVHRALADQQAWDREVRRLCADAPAFLFEAGVRDPTAIDEATLRAVLELMVGNRSSFLHTMIDGDGRFRVIPAPSRWIGHAKLCVGLGRRELERELGRRLLVRGALG